MPKKNNWCSFEKKSNLKKMVIGVVICWLPFHVTNLVVVYGRKMSLKSCEQLHHVTNWYILNQIIYDNLAKNFSFVWLHPCLNPVLYSFSGVRFRQKMAQTFKILTVGKSTNIDSFDSKEPVTASQSGPGHIQQLTCRFMVLRRWSPSR